jgi:hypothetical protein
MDDQDSLIDLKFNHFFTTLIAHGLKHEVVEFSYNGNGNEVEYNL